MARHNKKKFCTFQSLELVATNTVQIKEGQTMFQKLILAVTMTFALNLLLETRPPVLAQAELDTKVALAQILKARTNGSAGADEIEGRP